MGHGNGTGTDKWDMGTGQEQIYGTWKQDRKRLIGNENGTGPNIWD